jgi:hypothetical protein
MGAPPQPMGGAAPPVDPNVAAQQMPSMGQFAGQMGGQQGGDPAMDFLVSKMNEIAASLTDVAKVISQRKPALMPIIQKMAQAGSMIMSEVQSGQQQGGADSSLAQPQAGGESQMGLGQ